MPVSLFISMILVKTTSTLALRWPDEETEVGSSLCSCPLSPTFTLSRFPNAHPIHAKRSQISLRYCTHLQVPQPQ